MDIGEAFNDSKVLSLRKAGFPRNLMSLRVREGKIITRIAAEGDKL
jgi:hypothetical protein